MTTTMPERSDTLAAQIQWLIDGKRRAVLVTPGERLPEIPDGFECVATCAGVVVYDPDYYAGGEIKDLARGRMLGQLLGYGVAEKPSEAIGAVTIRAADGTEKQAVVVDGLSYPTARAAAEKVKDPGDRVALEDCGHVTRGRAGNVLERCLEVRPLREPADCDRLEIAADEDAYHPILPTHIIERDGEIVGCVGVNSLPLFRVWLHRTKVRARESVAILNVIENGYRAQGGGIVFSLLAPDSPFRAVQERFGYHALGLGVLLVKKL
ncbi:MAG: hypothetical protein HW378_174 [Anaerolineales bacterium]|nr:hypothetical protein [Anaerolineales bacterium]